MSCIIRIEPAPGALVRVISDLHLGHERCEVPNLILPEGILEGVDHLIIAGDLAESRVCEWKDKGIALREQLRELCRARGVQLTELAGNHDPDVHPQLALLWEGRVAIMHGHALFKEVSPWSWEYLGNKQACNKVIAENPQADTDLEARLELARTLSQLTPPVMRREGIKNKYLRGFLHCFWPPQRPWGIVSCWLTFGWRAERFARQYLPNVKTMVMGHFHRSGRWRYGDRTIVNTGAWFKHATPYVADLRDGKLISYRKAL